jgi:glyoxylase-like metal-dependent hydrolase (beta-lactamase superfamily II)
MVRVSRRSFRVRYHAVVRLTIAFLAATAAYAQFPSPTLTEVTTKVSEHVFMTTGFPNVVYVVGDAATLVVDTGLGTANGALVARVAKRLSKGPKLFLTTTHYHPEHAAGVGGFPPETILIRPAVQQQELEKEGEQTMTFFRNSAQFAPSLKGLGPLRPPDITFESEAKLDLGGGLTVRLMFLGAGHTASDELIFVERDRALITGDIVQNKVVPSVASSGGSFSSWLTVLDKLVPLQPRLVIPTHSKVGDASLITSEAAFIRDMQSRAAALKRSGVSSSDAVTRLTEVFKTNYPDWVANTDWPNLNSMTGFVNRLYAEIR